MGTWDYMDEFKAFTLQNKSQKTCEAYIYDLQLFQKYLKKDITNATQLDIEEYKNHLILSKRVKANTVNRKLTSIKRFIDYLNKNKATSIDLTLKFLKVQRQTFLNETLELSDLERLIRQAEKINDKRAIAMFYVMFYTGVRVSELLQLTIKIVDKEQVEVLGKGSKYRTVLINKNINEYITNYIDERGHKNNSLLFINENNDNGMSRQSVDRLIKFYAGKAKVKLSKAHAHNFRHLNALSCISQGISIEEVADLLGHNDLNTTRIYTRHTKKELMKANNSLKIKPNKRRKTNNG